MLVINSLVPVFALVGLGATLRHFQLTDTTFLATCDRLIYYIFFPALLFWKIGSASSPVSAEAARFFAAVGAAVLIVYVLSTLFIVFGKVGTFQAGSFSQSCYRFNTYIGMAIILNALGEPAVAQFGVLIGVVIPLINILSVATLIWFGGQKLSRQQRLRVTLRELISNPLIIGCAAGLVYGRWIGRFPQFIDNMLALAAMVTLPLALLSIGGSLTFHSLKEHFRLTLAGAGFKLAVLPAVGYGFMRLLAIGPADIRVGMLYFALPTSTTIYVLSSQLNSDTRYASAAIVMSTLLSFFSLSGVLVFFFN